jgi:hypothetical protein
MGCERAPRLPAHVGPTYHFLVGPDSNPLGEVVHRTLADVPSKYIELDQEPSEQPTQLASFTFAYHYPDLRPVRRDQLALPGVVIASFGWEPPGSVRKRLDGTWLNYYSRYKVKRPDNYGLNAATGSDGIDTSILFYSIEDEVMIDCQRIFMEPLRSCNLTTKLKPFLYEEVKFSASLLPQWRKLMWISASLVSTKKET